MFKANITTYDRNNKPSQMSFGLGDAPVEANVTAVAALFNSILVGTDVSVNMVESTELVAGAVGPAASALAQRQNKWIFRFQVGAAQPLEPGKIYHHFLGTADNNVLPTAQSDFVDLSVNPGLAFKTGLDLVWRSPLGETGELISIQNTDD